MIELKSPADIERMRVTGEFVAEVLAELRDLTDVGVNLLELEHRTRELLRQRGAVSCYWDYAPSFGDGPFRNVILSVNGAHGGTSGHTRKAADAAHPSSPGWAARRVNS